MILAEKLIKLRKQNGWSQEDLAMKLNVSRQSVSKWESMASIPDLDKIVKLSQIFGVSTDYLLRDDIEGTPEWVANENAYDIPAEPSRKIEMEEANQYMNNVQKASLPMAIGVALCILSPIPLIMLGGLQEYGNIRLTETAAGGIGVIILLVMIACAVAMFISIGMKLEKYEYMEKENLDLEYGIAGIVEKKKETFTPAFQKAMIAGVCLCILSVVPIMLGVFGGTDLTMVCCVCTLLFMIASGVFLFLKFGMIKSSYDKLLEEGDYTREKKNFNRKNAAAIKIYWCVITAIYLGISFVTMRWDSTWIIWPVAAVLFGAVEAILAVKQKNK